MEISVFSSDSHLLCSVVFRSNSEVSKVLKLILYKSFVFPVLSSNDIIGLYLDAKGVYHIEIRPN